jgi:hypothetical protein
MTTTTSKRYTTQPLNAECYIRGGKGHLTHLAEIDENRIEVAVGCRVKVEHLLGDGTQYTHEAPTCPTCAKKFAKLSLRPEIHDDCKVWVVG